jgi:hypothetical protein
VTKPRVEDLIQTVEDQVQPVLEFVAVVVAGFEDGFYRQFGEVGICVCGGLGKDSLCCLGSGSPVGSPIVESALRSPGPQAPLADGDLAC